MNSQHLSDIEIQKFLFQESDPDPAASGHLKQCTECSIKTDQYRLIFEMTGKEKKPVFEFELTKLVMKKLPFDKAKGVTGKLLVYLFLIIVLPVGGILIYLFYTRFSSLLTGLSPYSGYLIATGVISLLLFQSMDSFTRYMKQINAMDLH